MRMQRKTFRYLEWSIAICFSLVILYTGSLPAQAQEEGQVYIIQTNDSLWRLAEKYLGDGNRFSLIIEATSAKATTDASLTPIADPGLLHPGQKIWIPAETTAITASSPATSTEPKVQSSSPNAPANGPVGQIAFSFWNNHPNRCTYEVNVINVSDCLQSGAQCQASRRILPLNNISEPALSPDGSRLAFRSWGEPSESDSPFLSCAAAHPARFLGNTTLDGSNFTGTGGFWEDAHPDGHPTVND